MAILQALEDNGLGQHHVMDPFEGSFGDSGLELVRRAGLQHRLVFHRKHAEEVIPALGPVGFAFIDASHLFDLTLLAFALIDKKLAIGGLVGFHDLWLPSQRKVLGYILSNRAYEPWRQDRVYKKKKYRRFLWIFRRKRKDTVEGYLLGNLTIIQKKAEDTRNWDFHRPF